MTLPFSISSDASIPTSSPGVVRLSNPNYSPNPHTDVLGVPSNRYESDNESNLSDVVESDSDYEM